MPKIGRNEPCPCGSGKKYKKCCESSPKPPSSEYSPDHDLHFSYPHWIVDNLDRDSNNVVFLIIDGKLDEAEKAAHKLLLDYPDVDDGFERLAMVYEAKGDNARAADMYQRTLDFTLDKDGYDEELRDFYREKIKKLSKSVRPNRKASNNVSGVRQIP